MDVEKEINSLAGETIAIQNVLAHVLYRISQIDDRFLAAIKKGFSEATSQVEDMAIRHGKASSPHHLVKAIDIIETLRTATLGDKDKPRHAV